METPPVVATVSSNTVESPTDYEGQLPENSSSYMPSHVNAVVGDVGDSTVQPVEGDEEHVGVQLAPAAPPVVADIGSDQVPIKDDEAVHGRNDDSDMLLSTDDEASVNVPSNTNIVTGSAAEKETAPGSGEDEDNLSSTRPKRRRRLSGEDSGTDPIAPNASGIDNTDSGKDKVPSLSVGSRLSEQPKKAPRRSERPKKAPPIDISSIPKVLSRPPVKKKRRVTSPTKQAVSSVDINVDDAGDEAENIKPMLWTQPEQDTREATVSTLQEYMEKDVSVHVENEDDPKCWLDIAPMDDQEVVAIEAFRLFTITGEPRDFTFKFTVIDLFLLLMQENANITLQDSDDAILFKQLMDGVEKTYVNGMPRFLTSPETSAFRILSNSEYTSLRPMDIMSTFAQQSIVITDLPCNQVSWTPEAMAKFGFINQTQTIYGETVVISNSLSILTAFPCRPLETQGST